MGAVSCLLLPELVILTASADTSTFHLEAELLFCHLNKFFTANSNALYPLAFADMLVVS
jgi:hypothetical protein